MFDDAVFLDVGAHNGQTLDEVVKPIYGFRTIFSFEPMPLQFHNLLDAYRIHPQIQLFDYGLGDSTHTMNLYGSNRSMEASIYETKQDLDASIVTPCPFVEASSFFSRHLSMNETVIMKLNCEGSEIPILNNLIDSGEIWKLTNVMIDFDIRKVAGMAQHEHILHDRLKAIGFDRYSLCEDVMVGPTHQARIANWLHGIA